MDFAKHMSDLTDRIMTGVILDKLEAATSDADVIFRLEVVQKVATYFIRDQLYLEPQASKYPALRQDLGTLIYLPDKKLRGASQTVQGKPFYVSDTELRNFFSRFLKAVTHYEDQSPPKIVCVTRLDQYFWPLQNINGGLPTIPQIYNTQLKEVGELKKEIMRFG